MKMGGEIIGGDKKSMGILRDLTQRATWGEMRAETSFLDQLFSTGKGTMDFNSVPSGDVSICVYSNVCMCARFSTVVFY